MDSGTINISTGPVRISAAVKAALSADPVSHRARSFLQLYTDTTEKLSRSFNVRDTFLLTGSGTLANEAMLHQVKQIKGRGLILSNGEFGSRLINQAQSIGLEFSTYSLPWGEQYQISDIQQRLTNNSPAWMAFVHCETSTGVVNDIEGLCGLAKGYDCWCFADCMSTVGTRPIDLSMISMATASSGKGLASIPGLAVVFSNMEPLTHVRIPSYLDLAIYARKGGVPYTVSSNLVSALYQSLQQKLVSEQYSLLETYREKISSILSQASLAPFDQTRSFVFTLVPAADEYDELREYFSQSGLTVSYESDYLKKRRWIQIALFNLYQEGELQQVVNSLKNIRTLSC